MTNQRTQQIKKAILFAQSLIVFLLFFNLSIFAQTQSERNYASVQFSLDHMDCESGIACYNIQIHAEESTEWELTNQNYRIFYNSKMAEFMANSAVTVLPQPAYSSIQLLNEVSHLDASGVWGGLNFDSDLGFINLAINKEENDTNGLSLSEVDGWISTAQICFQMTEEAMSLTDEYLHVIWAREEFTAAYSSAYTLIGGKGSDGTESDVEIVVYNELDFYNPAQSIPQLLCSTNTTAEAKLIMGQGNIKLPNNMSLMGVDLQLNNSDHAVDVTDDNGSFRISMNNELNNEIIPIKNDNVLNGVDREDFNALMYHIAGNEPFEHAYQYYAADLNDDQVIDLFDALALLRVMMGAENAFPNGKSYKFIASDYEVVSPEWAYPLYQDVPSSRMVKNGENSQANLDFVAIKLGDITGSRCSDCLKSKLYAKARSEREKSSDALVEETTLFPNPNNGSFKLNIATTSQNLTEVSIYSYAGTLIEQLNVDKVKNQRGQLHLQLSSINDGMFMVHIISDTGREVIPFIVIQ